MSVHTFEIQFPDGFRRIRSEWGRTRRDAVRTLWSIYGRDIIIRAV